MRHVWSPPPASATAAAAVTKGSPGRNRPRLNAISFTPDTEEDTAARLLSSNGDRDVVEGGQRLAPDGRTSSSAVKVGNGRLAAADGTGNDDDVQRRDDDAAVQALLRELGVEPSSVSK